MHHLVKHLSITLRLQAKRQQHRNSWLIPNPDPVCFTSLQLALIIWMKIWSLWTYNGSCSEKWQWFTGWLAFVFGRLNWKYCSHSSKEAKDGENDHSWEFFKISWIFCFLLKCQELPRLASGLHFLPLASRHCCLQLCSTVTTLFSVWCTYTCNHLERWDSYWWLHHLFSSAGQPPIFYPHMLLRHHTSGPYLERCALLTSVQYLRNNSCTQIFFSDLKIPVNVVLCHQD